MMLTAEYCQSVFLCLYVSFSGIALAGASCVGKHSPDRVNDAAENELAGDRFSAFRTGIPLGVTGYSAGELGPIGERLVRRNNSPEEMDMLRQCLATRDGPTVVPVERDIGDEVIVYGLPLRACDYALIIAAQLVPECACGPPIGVGTSYEWRDKARRQVFKVLFGTELSEENVEYTYVDKDGKDVSTEHRWHPGFP